MIWGAMNNASLAMLAMDRSMGSISQNVANVNTTGYKRKETTFQTLLSEGHATPASTVNSTDIATATTGLDIFSVRAVDRNIITKQGIITPSGNWTDLAINGRGFFIVAPPGSNGKPPDSIPMSESDQFLYTRAGNFQSYGYHPDSEYESTKLTATSVTDPSEGPGAKDVTYFTTGSGQFLMGWMADAQGRIPGVATTAASPVTGTSNAATGVRPALEPIYITPNSKIDGVATTAILPMMNLPADATLTSPSQSFVHSKWITNPSDSTKSYDLTMSWTRSGQDSWTLACSLPAAAGATLSPAKTSVTLNRDDTGKVTVTPTAPTLDVTWANGTTESKMLTLADIVSGTASEPLPSLNETPVTLTLYDNAFEPQTLPVWFERVGSGEWNMRIRSSTAYTVTALGAEGGASGSGSETSVPIRFDGDGRVLSPSAISFSVKWTPRVDAVTPTPVEIPAALKNYAVDIQSVVGSVSQPTLPATAAQLAAYQTNLTTALTSSVTVAAPAGTADLAAYAAQLGAALSAASAATQAASDKAAAAAGSNTVRFDTSKLTGYYGLTAGKVDIRGIDQDGYESGYLDGTEFNARGELIGHFNNGRTRTLAMVPVATFTAADQLDPLSGTLFRRTANAGDLVIDVISGQGSGNQMVASSLEASNVDLADEFTRMIITQKAYSMNATVFKTSDEMTVAVRDMF